MSDKPANPFENTNSGPSALSPEAPKLDAGCQAGGCGCQKTSALRTASRIALYSPIALLVAGIVAVWAMPGLADYATPLIRLVDPNFGGISKPGGACCSSDPSLAGTSEASCCSSVSKAALLTRGASEVEASSGDEAEGTCPLCAAAKAPASEPTTVEEPSAPVAE